MKILIIEDEPPIADYIETMTRRVLENSSLNISKVHTLGQARQFLEEHPIDLCLLDLNLNGKNGYDLLHEAVSGAFHTIIISAYVDQAVHAFEYGVLDFVPKPFNEERLKMAFDRYSDLSYRHDLAARYITVHDHTGLKVIDMDRFVYFKGADNYVEGVLVNGDRELIDKPLYRLLQVLPPRFFQIHRSYVVDIKHMHSFGHAGDGKYQLIMDTGETLPLGRTRYKELCEKFKPMD